STTLANGGHTLAVTAYFSDGATASASVSVTVSNLAPAPAPAPAPSHSVSESVANGSTLSGAVSWTASPSDPPTKVEFSIDGVLKWTETWSPYVYTADGNSVDTTTLANGGHTLAVTAYFSDGAT